MELMMKVQFSSVTQSCPPLCDPMNRSMPGLPVHPKFLESTQTHVHRVSDAIQLSHPLLLLPLIFLSIRVFSNESAVHIRWPKYWSFSFKISPSTWKQPRCPLADEWMRKPWYIYTMEYYSAIKKNSFESILMRWMKLKPIIRICFNTSTLLF